MAQTVAHTQVCADVQACAAQTDVWQIALSRPNSPRGSTAAGRLLISVLQKPEKHDVDVNVYVVGRNVKYHITLYVFDCICV